VNFHFWIYIYTQYIGGQISKEKSQGTILRQFIHHTCKEEGKSIHLWESVGTIKNSLCSEEKISLELYSQTNLLSFFVVRNIAEQLVK
jgi:hypothetical protein